MVTVDDVDMTFLPATSTASHTLPICKGNENINTTKDQNTITVHGCMNNSSNRPLRALYLFLAHVFPSNLSLWQI